MYDHHFDAVDEIRKIVREAYDLGKNEHQLRDGSDYQLELGFLERDAEQVVIDASKHDCRLCSVAEGYCTRLGPDYSVKGSGMEAYHYRQADDSYEIKVVGFLAHVSDGTNVVQVEILYQGLLMASVTEIPNDADTVLQVVSQIMNLYGYLNGPDFHIECDYETLDEYLADIWDCVEEDEERICSEDECLAELCPFSEESRGHFLGERINALVNCELIPVQVRDAWLDLDKDLGAFQEAGWSTHVID